MFDSLETKHYYYIGGLLTLLIAVYYAYNKFYGQTGEMEQQMANANVNPQMNIDMIIQGLTTHPQFVHWIDSRSDAQISKYLNDPEEQPTEPEPQL